MAQKSKMMQFLRKLQEMQIKYVNTVGIDVRPWIDSDDGTLSISFNFVSKVQTYTEDDGKPSAKCFSGSLYMFWSAKENKKVLDGFIKECSKENQLILANSFKSCKNLKEL